MEQAEWRNERILFDAIMGIQQLSNCWTGYDNGSKVIRYAGRIAQHTLMIITQKDTVISCVCQRCKHSPWSLVDRDAPSELLEASSIQKLYKTRRKALQEKCSNWLSCTGERFHVDATTECCSSISRGDMRLLGESVWHEPRKTGSLDGRLIIDSAVLSWRVK